MQQRASGGPIEDRAPLRGARGATGTAHQRSRAARPAIARGVLLIAVTLSASTRLVGQEEQPDAPGEARESRRFTLDGFGTVGLVYSSEDRADFVGNGVRPDGAGFTRDWSPEVDSRLGLQLTAGLTKKLTAVVQVIAEQQHDDRLGPTLEWANLSYAVTDDLSVRVGRTALPVFGSSDFRKVDYAHPWVRPPVELYGLVPFFHSNGVDVRYRHRAGGWTNNLQAIAGGVDVDLPGDGAEARIRKLVALFDSVERGALTLHASLSTSQVSIAAFDPLFAGFRAFGAPGEAIAERFELDDRRARYASVGASYDPARWFVRAELGRVRTRSVLGDRTAGYLTVGRRLGDVTILGTYAEVASDGPTSSPGLDLAVVPPPLRPSAQDLNLRLNNALAGIAVQRTFSAAARWDFRSGAALTMQVDRVDIGAGSNGTFVDVQPGFERGGEVTLVSVATSFVF